MKKMKIATLLFAVLSTATFAQTVTQSVRGKLFDNLTQAPLPYANIVVLDSDPLIGTTSDMDGNFILDRVPVGRHSIKVMMMGYENRMINELLISTGKQTMLQIGLHQTTLEMDELVVSISKDVPLNTMSK